MTVPADKIPLTDEFVCSGVPTSTGWTSPGSSLNYNGNMSKTMLVGYMTTNYYEGAILKGNIVD